MVKLLKVKIKRKCIFWLAVAAVVCALVFLVWRGERTGDALVTKAEAAKMIAALMYVGNDFGDAFSLAESGTDNGNWYHSYVRYVNDNGHMEIDNAGEPVTVGDVRHFLDSLGCNEEMGQDFPWVYGDGYASVERKDWVSLYIWLWECGNNEEKTAGLVLPGAQGLEWVSTVLLGTPANVEEAGEWEAYTEEGRYHFTGLHVDGALDRQVEFLARDGEIICIASIGESAVINNAWIVSGGDGGLEVFTSGITRHYDIGTLSQELGGVMADIYLEGGRVRTIEVKEETISGRVLSATREYVELEGYGRVPLEENYRIYRVYGGLSLEDYGNLIVGYDLQEFIVANGRICGAAIIKQMNADRIRVLIKTTDYKDIFHDAVTLVSGTGMQLEGSEQEKTTIAPGEPVTINAASELLKGGRVSITPLGDGEITVSSIKRSNGNPHYEGTLEVMDTGDGLVLVNDVGLEDYLKRVVPSEMPVGFGVEALKVQAVCARSYAYRELENNNYVAYGAHVDDSTLYQVYNNVDESDAANQAIAQTEGQVLAYGGEPVQTFYYSTSCGVTTDVTLWGSSTDEYPYYRSVVVGSGSSAQGIGNLFVGDDLVDEAAFSVFIKNINASDYDSGFELYRWQLTVSLSELSNAFNSRLADRGSSYPRQIGACDNDGNYLGLSGGTSSGIVSDIGQISGITVLKRVTGGACVSIMVRGSKGNVRIDGESHIRYLLGVYDAPLVTVNGSTRHMSSLPSTFCIFEETIGDDGKTYMKITGGGYGHGIGMSQNAVSAMTAAGMGYTQVLEFFYPGTQVMNVGAGGLISSRGA